MYMPIRWLHMRGHAFECAHEPTLAPGSASGSEVREKLGVASGALDCPVMLGRLVRCAGTKV